MLVSTVTLSCLLLFTWSALVFSSLVKFQRFCAASFTRVANFSAWMKHGRLSLKSLQCGHINCEAIKATV